MTTIDVTERVGSKAKVVITGVLDLNTGDELLRKLAKLVDRGYVRLSIDAAGVSFCDSSGLGALLRTRTQATSLGGSLVLVDASPQLRKLLQITGLLKILQTPS